MRPTTSMNQNNCIEPVAPFPRNDCQMAESADLLSSYHPLPSISSIQNGSRFFQTSTFALTIVLLKGASSL